MSQSSPSSIFSRDSGETCYVTCFVSWTKYLFKRVRLNYATTHHYPPPAKICPPPPTTTHKMDHHLAKAMYIHIQTVSFFCENTTVLYVTGILCDKVLISSFFKFKIILHFTIFKTLHFKILRLQDLFLFVFIHKIIMLI